MGEGPVTEPAEIRTFLIADVRGYTLFTQERGDEAAAKLAARFAGIAREVVEEHGGSVIELRGDEALAVFSSARQAILAATHAQDRFLVETVADPTLPLPVGIGLDAGEAVRLEGGYRGGALNLAARLCGQAGPGEILASQGVIHLARKVDGVRVVDKGTLHLKGLTEPVGVVRLISEEADPAVRFRELAPAEPRRGPAPVRLVRRHPVIAGLVALALIAAIVPTAFLLQGEGTAEPIDGDAIAKIGLESGEPEGSVALASRPGDVAVGEGGIWVTLPDRAAVQQIDPATMTIRDTIPVGADPGGIAIGFDSVWVTNGGSATVSRIDLRTGEVVETIDVPGGPTGIAVDERGDLGRQQLQLLGLTYRSRDRRHRSHDRRGRSPGRRRDRRQRRLGGERRLRHRLPHRPQRSDRGNGVRRSATGPRRSRPATGRSGWPTPLTARSPGSIRTPTP